MSETLMRALQTAGDAGSPMASGHLVAELAELSGMTIYTDSISRQRETLWFLGRRGPKKRPGALADSIEALAGFDGQRRTVPVSGGTLGFVEGSTSAANARALRETFTFLRPQTLGLSQSIGLGDRVGLATPGHIAALRTQRGDASPAPILAQQSVRENTRLGRTPQSVVDDAMWGVFQAGWRGGYGADADHLKQLTDIDGFVAAGYTFYTIDPSEHVDVDAERASPMEVRARFDALPWEQLETRPSDCRGRWVGRRLQLDSTHVEFDPDAFARAFAAHVNVAREFGPYKLSLHSGSDKFSIYPVATRIAAGCVHLKTAGTSYLEALRAVAAVEPELFRGIVVRACERYACDRATYHVSADAKRVPDIRRLADADLPGLLDHFDTRQVLHVTFGTILGDPVWQHRVASTLCAHEAVYADMLQAHTGRHLAAFSRLPL